MLIAGISRDSTSCTTLRQTLRHLVRVYDKNKFSRMKPQQVSPWTWYLHGRFLTCYTSLSFLARLRLNLSQHDETILAEICRTSKSYLARPKSTHA